MNDVNKLINWQINHTCECDKRIKFAMFIENGFKWVVMT